MNVKFEYISTKKPKWHIYHTNNYMGNGILTFKNNETGKQFQYADEIQYDYSSYNDYVHFSDKVWNYLNTDKENMPFSEEEIKIIQGQILDKKVEVSDFFKNNTDTTVILREPATEESQIDTYKLEAEHQAATAIVEANMAEFHAERQEIKEKEREEREALIAEAYKMAGKIEAFKFISNFADVGSLSLLKKIKESKVYKEMPTIKTWDNYCKSIGLSASKVDEDLNNIATFGEKFITDVGNFGLGYRELRQLKKQVKSGSLEIKDETVIIDGEVIPLDDKDELRDALDTLLKSKYKEIEEKDKKIKDQSESIEIKNNEIARLRESNKNFFESKEKAEKALADLKGVGTIHGITIEENADFQKIADIEREVEVIYNRLKVVSGYDLSEFNKKKLGAVVIKAMNLLHDFHQELCALGVQDYYGEAFMPDEVIDAEGRLETPESYLKNNK